MEKQAGNGSSLHPPQGWKSRVIDSHSETVVEKHLFNLARPKITRMRHPKKLRKNH